MAELFITNRRVEFRDTDAAGIAHFSTFFAFMEAAEHEFLRSVGLSVMERQAGETISWPRVSAGCDFSGAAKFEDVVEIEVGIERLGSKSVTYRFRFSLAGREIASGKMTSVCCVLQPGRPPRSIEIPQRIVEKLKPYSTGDDSPKDGSAVRPE